MLAKLLLSPIYAQLINLVKYKITGKCLLNQLIGTLDLTVSTCLISIEAITFFKYREHQGDSYYSALIFC